MKLMKLKLKLFIYDLRPFLVVFTVIVVVIVGSVLSLEGAIRGLQAHSWTSEMQSMSISFYQGNSFSITMDGKNYETVSLPEGVDKDMLYDAIDLAQYDDVMTSSAGFCYLYFRDPLNTGEDVGLLLPLNLYPDFWGELGKPFALYVKEVTGE